MFDLRDDGTTVIDFGDRKVTVRPPKLGGYRRLRGLIARIDTKDREFVAHLPEDMDEGEKQAERQSHHEEQLIAWWTLVLRGDDSFAALTDDEVPADPDDWPLECATNPAALSILNHWILRPLASTAAPAPETT